VNLEFDDGKQSGTRAVCHNLAFCVSIISATPPLSRHRTLNHKEHPLLRPDNEEELKDNLRFFWIVTEIVDFRIINGYLSA
jgi:hypothetical protein